MATAIEITDLSHSYGERVALAGVTFTCDEDQTIAILGPNGSGKTTLFKILATALSPQSGTVKLFNRSITSNRNQHRAAIGVVLQSSSLDRKLTVAENLRHHGHLYGLWGSALRNRIDDVLAELAVADRKNDLLDLLSGGLQRRVELAKGLLHQPRLLLLDEPTAGLDVAARTQFWELIAEVRKRASATVVYSTHLIDEAERADQVAILNNGQLVAFDEPGQLKATVQADVITIESLELDRLTNILEKDLGLPVTSCGNTVRIETDDSAQIVGKIASACDGMVNSMKVNKSGLEDVFLALTGEEFTR